MNKLDTYLSLCTEVYDLSKKNPPQDAYAFYREYALNSNGPILEPMCGTGRFLLPLFEEGFDIQGFDASEHMLNALKIKADAKNLKPTVWNSFVEDLKKSKKYNLIFIPSGSFCLIINMKAIRSALQALYAHLSNNGILLLEVERPKSVPELDIWRGSVWHKKDGKIILLSQLASIEDGVCRSICKYELVDKNSIIHTEIEQLLVRIHELNILEKIFKDCGFKNIRKLKAFDKNSLPEENDETIIYECKK